MNGRWSPDGRFYYFLQSSEEHFPGQIWMIDERRHHPWQPSPQPMQLTNGPIQWYPPLPGKDGKSLFAVGETRRGELNRYDPKTKLLTPFLKGVSGEFVAFSGDGKSVAYVSYPDGILWKANRDGSNRVQLSSPPMYPANPQWSPDGSQILFWDTFIRDKVNAYIVSPDGEKPPQRLLPDGPDVESDPNWSADGQRVVFAARQPATNKEELRILDLVTHQVTAVPGSTAMYSPRWSPDGRYLSAVSVEASRKLVLYDFHSQKWSDWFAENDNFNYGQWSAKGQYFYWDNFGSNPKCRRIKLGEHRAEDLFSLNTLRRHFGLFGSWSGMAPDDSRLFVRDVSTQDIYSLDVDFP